jgi:2,3-bisphosphoglycerate-independent phosphoglycerate mutase
MKKQVALIILDGWGYREELENNAIASAKTPFFDSLWEKYPHTLLKAGEDAVGLPKGQVGNSEIGHMTIGAGKVIDTDLIRIEKSILSGEFKQNSAFQNLFKHVKKNNSVLHILGLIGEGGVHSHQSHLLAFLEAAKSADISQIFIHAFTDGRDNGPYDSIQAIESLQNFLIENDAGQIATISGRYYAMDRDNNWNRLEKFTQFLFDKNSEINNNSILEEVKKQHQAGKTDEHIEPIQFIQTPLTNGDGVFFFNFRADRARMLSTKILEKVEALNLNFVTMTEYGSDFKTEIAFPPSLIETTIAKEIFLSELSQAHIAETEKFPHATYFLNGGVEEPYLQEEHILIPSRKDVITHDEAPEMRAKEIADKAVEQIKKGTNFIFINFANPDMIGHTANVPAIIQAIEFVDKQLERVVNELVLNDGVAFITADHGNAEINIDSVSGDKHTAHTLSLVPAILTLDNTYSLIENGSLKDIAPTILEIFDIKKPKAMTGESLIIRLKKS